MYDAPKTRIALLVFGVLGIVATLLPFIPTNEWWVRAFDFPRVLIATVIAVILFLFLFVRRRGLLDGAFCVLSAAAIVYQLVRIAPYTPLMPLVVPTAADCGDDGLRIVTANVLQTNRDSVGFLDIVRRASPDLLLVVETDGWWEEELRPIEEDYPFTVREPLDNTYGMLFYSKLDVSSAEIRHLVQDDIPSIRATITLRSGRTFQFYGVHPRPPNPDQDSDARDGELVLVAQEVADSERPSVVAGDLNDVAWSDTTELFEEVGGLRDPRKGRGLFSTFHADYFIFRWPLDHVFVTPSFQIRHMEVLSEFGSDHMPVQVDLCFVPSSDEQPEPPSESEREDAEEAIREARDGED